MNTNFDPNSTAAASLPMPARRFPVRYLAVCAVALCISPNLYGAPVEMIFDGVNGAEGFGAYLSPYYGTMDGTSVELFCVDYANEVQFGEQWDANLTPIAPGADLSDTRWGGEPDALTQYEEAAWLSLQFAAQPVSQYADIQATMWQLFYGAAPSPSSPYWLEQAQANYASGDYGDFAIVTNVGPVQQFGQVQEFLTELPSSMRFESFDQPQSNIAPEPGTQAMIGLALVGAGCVGRRRWTKRCSATHRIR
jgi:hypothetical protein